MSAPLLGWGLAAFAGALLGILNAQWEGYFWWCALAFLLLTFLLQLKPFRSLLLFAEYALLITFGFAWAAFVSGNVVKPLLVDQRIPVYSWCDITCDPMRTNSGWLVTGTLEHSPPITVQIFYRDASYPLRSGDRIKFTGELSPFDSMSFLTYGSRERYAAASGSQARVTVHRIVTHHPNPNHLHRISQQAATAIREKISTTLHQAIPGEAAMLSEALLLGNYAQLDPMTIAGFRKTGLLHLLALSGLQVMVMWALFEAFGSILRLKFHYRMAFIVCCLFGYWWLLPDIASVDRAFVMALFLIAMRWRGKHHSPWQPWGGALLLLSLWQPHDVVTPGFQLSFAAVGSILFYLRHHSQIFPTPVVRLNVLQKGIRWSLDAICISCVALLGTIPVMVYHFGFVSFAGILLNLPAIPISNAILIAAILILLLSPVPLLPTLLGQGVAKLTDWLFTIATFPGMQWGAGSRKFVPLLFATFALFLTIHWVLRKQWRFAVVSLFVLIVTGGIAIRLANRIEVEKLHLITAANGKHIYFAHSNREAQRFTQFWLKRNGSFPVTIASRVALFEWSKSLPASVKIIELGKCTVGVPQEIELGIFWTSVITETQNDNPVTWGYYVDTHSRVTPCFAGLSPHLLAELGWKLQLPIGDRLPIEQASLHPSGEWFRQRWNDTLGKNVLQ
ncbi:MAG: ComEC/Rec2 family competence protein [bacterium]|nr:ComEC/Rec2 family competence protein [bacterium]